MGAKVHYLLITCSSDYRTNRIKKTENQLHVFLSSMVDVTAAFQLSNYKLKKGYWNQVCHKTIEKYTNHEKIRKNSNKNKILIKNRKYTLEGRRVLMLKKSFYFEKS